MRLRQTLPLIAALCLIAAAAQARCVIAEKTGNDYYQFRNDCDREVTVRFRSDDSPFNQVVTVPAYRTRGTGVSSIYNMNKIYYSQCDTEDLYSTPPQCAL